MKRTSLTAIGAFLALIALSGCAKDSGGDGTPSPDGTPAPSSVTESPAATTPSPAARDTIAADAVTEAQKKACVDAIIVQIRSKKGGDMPAECAILPDEVLAPLVDEALSGG